MTSVFRTPLRFQDDEGLPFVLIDSLVYESALLARTFIVPAGFKTDLASIPRGLWNILPPVGRYDKAAVIHDFLYQTSPIQFAYHGAKEMTRGDADAVLNEAMEVCGVSRWQRWMIYAGVRVGGWKVWNAYRSATVQV